VTDKRITAEAQASPLDLLSISQKICTYSAPYLAMINGASGKIIQTCCNHWDCPRCGEMRAKHEYGRIVSGAQSLGAKHKLYFYTFTCRGRDLSLDDAQRDYLLWTNRLLSTMRQRCKKEGGTWVYVQVTERQKRGHPHSHLLMAWIPSDAKNGRDDKGNECILSEWFKTAHHKAGLGTQCQITEVKSVEATARYVAKYLFKDAQFTRMPPNWKRIRYSHSFPQKTETEKNQNIEYMTVGKDHEWRAIAKLDISFVTDDINLYHIARRRIANIGYTGA